MAEIADRFDKENEDREKILTGATENREEENDITQPAIDSKKQEAAAQE